MSTFNGIVSEFPRIRIDYFRTNPAQPSPLACFLSHVHSDHLQGLESLKSPFVYCSPATRRLLLRMEKYPHRMNFAKGILEVRKQTYQHLQLILKAIPLQTPTEIELGASMKIRVTLFDANHCPGAVMFLIEGDGKAVLYTGDIRPEAWWVHSITRSPVLIPYTLGQKRLDCIYLDTTFASKDDVYEDFPAKATGLQELLEKVGKCSPETVFYFRAWTLGYEDVWIALSAALGSKVHVDEYQSRLYRSLSEDNRDCLSVLEAPALNGFQAGNHNHPGCLTTDSSDVRIHSCEPGTACYAQLTKAKDVVWITPIITRSRGGAIVYEVGAGGGGGDLYQTAELDVTDVASVEALANLCVEWIKDPKELSNVLRQLSSAQTSRNSQMSLDELGLDTETGISLKQLVSRMARFGDHKDAGKEASGYSGLKLSNSPSSSDAIHFPYSRHASYNELRDLVSVFKPRDICPCTVDEEIWSEEVSMEALFGDLCSGSYFMYDRTLRSRLQDKNDRDETVGSRKRKREGRQETQESENSQETYQTPNGSFQIDATEARLLNQSTRRRTREDLFHINQKAEQNPMADMKTKYSVEKRKSPVHMSVCTGTGTRQPANNLPPVNPAQGPSRILQNPEGPSLTDLTEDEGPSSPPNARLEAIKSAFEVISRGSQQYTSDLPRPSDGATAIQQDSLSKREPKNQTIQSGLHDATVEVACEPESQLSLATSAFDSHPLLAKPQDGELVGLQLDGHSQGQTELLEHNKRLGIFLGVDPENGADAENRTRITPYVAAEGLKRRYTIKEAYRAARRCLIDGADIGSWEDLSLRSVGRKGHTEAEMEL